MHDEITIKRPDDWHLHLRDKQVLQDVLPYTSKDFARAIVMPNLVPPVTDAGGAIAYRKRILDADTSGAFQPLMTAYLTDHSDPNGLAQAYRDGVIVAVKLYPAGATTNADHGVTDIERVFPVFEKMQDAGLPLLVHGEVVGAEYDIYDREKIFLDTVLSRIHAKFPELKIVLEHVTTRQGIEFVEAASAKLAATITPHHLLINRSTMFQGGIRPHLYCLPIAKRAEHQQALRIAATSGAEKFFLGTDSAPHSQQAKQSACGCAGIFNAGTAMACYAQVFDEHDALDKLEQFASLNGPKFYGLPVNDGTLTLRKTANAMPVPETVGDDKIHQFLPDTPVYWQVTQIT